MSDSPIALSQDMILEKLKNVIDPELFVNIVDLGLIYEIEVDADNTTTEDQAEPQTEAVAGGGGERVAPRATLGRGRRADGAARVCDQPRGQGEGGGGHGHGHRQRHGC